MHNQEWNVKKARSRQPAASPTEITAFRARRLNSAAPDVARQGDARAWVEKDAEGRPWLFASADDLEGLHDSLSSLRYYGSQSFISVENGARPASGRWPVTESPMQLPLIGD